MTEPMERQDGEGTARPPDRAGETRGLAALVLAAGMSSRMRQLKPLLPFAGSTVLERAVHTFLDAGVEDVTVVIGHQGERFRPVLDALGVRWVVNPDFRQGMYSSVLAGMSALAPGVEGTFILPADMPAVRSLTVELVAHVFRGSGAAVVYPMFRGRRGHPPLIARRLFAAIVGGAGEGGLQQLLARHDEEACAVRVLDEGVVLDLDTRADYEAARASFGDRSVPSPGECLELLSELGVPDPVVRHGRAVAEVGGRIARALGRAGLALDIGLVETAGLLHDLAKGKPDHAAEAGQLLASLGFPRVAEVVAAHTDLPSGGREPLDEPALVFLADKLVQGERIVSLEDRFEAALERFSGSPALRAAVERRRAAAAAVVKSVERALGAGAVGRLAAHPAGRRAARRSRVHA
ncbi:MAG TPA: NTP transferase domain-containing protein [Anaeromyxobacter sp.]|nr:NTP transferase domain-containing protein [Anaeromyxobacter sp.]